MISNKQATALQVISKDKGLNIIVNDDHRQMALNIDYYRGNINNFHSFTRKTIKGQQVPCERFSFQMGQKVSEDYSTLMFGEDSHIAFKSEEINKRFKEIEKKYNFYANFINFLELTYALGNGYIIAYPQGDTVRIDYIQGDNVYISLNESKTVNGIVVVSKIETPEKEYMHITTHIYDEKEGMYRVVHELKVQQFDAENKNITADLGTPASMLDYQKVFGENVFEWLETKMLNSGERIYFHEQKTPFKWFEQFKPANANNFNTQSPYGTGIFSNARDTIRLVDIWMDTLKTEGEDAKTKIFVNTALLKKGLKADTGTGSLETLDFFESENTVFTAMPMEQVDGKAPSEPIKHVQPLVRTVEINEAINNALGYLGFRTGLGKTFYALKDGIVASTATEVLTNKNELWQNISKQQKGIENALINIAVAILEIDGLLNGNKFTEEELINIRKTAIIKFRDNVAIDDEAEYAKDLELVEKNMMSKKQFLMQWKNLSEKEAEEWLAEAEEESMKSQEAFFGGDKQEDNNEDEEIKDEPNEETENGVS